MSDDRKEQSISQASWVSSVRQVVEGIPKGYVLTYGDVAKLAGMPRAARRVSKALYTAPGEKPLPWHRVINAQGKISFPKDSAKYQQQMGLLKDEGVVFLNGKIDLKRYGWSGNVDRLLWGDWVED